MKFSDYFSECCDVIDGHDNILSITGNATEQSVPIGFIPKKIENMKLQILSGYTYNSNYNIITLAAVEMGTGTIMIPSVYSKYPVYLRIEAGNVVINCSNTYHIVFRIWEES